MHKTKSSRRWLQEHFDDFYVKKAQKEGFRSRSVYKLIELDEKFRLLKPNMKIIELGAAPGGWSQYAVSKINTRKLAAENRAGMLLAIDLLEMEPIDGVDFIQGDFTADSTLNELMEKLAKQGSPEKGYGIADLVMSDMAPNISGMNSVDQPRAMYLAELALDLACKVLKPGGVFLVKLFQGEGFDELSKEVKANFKLVRFIKPKASRARSREIYLLAMDYNLD